jgi:copper chaperone
MCTSSVGNDLGLTDKNHACSCSTDSGAAPLDLVPQGGVRELYLVEGMTCEHCVSSVTGALEGLDTVQNVSVDLRVGGTSRITVVSSAPVMRNSVRTAVTEAGYSLATE